MLKSTLTTLSTVLLISSPALADESWTGFYLGAQLGASKFTLIAIDDTNVSYGIHAGYNHDFGTFVAGAELDYDTSTHDFGGGDMDIDKKRLKFRAGYDLGRTLVYGLFGVMKLDGSGVSENGYTFGLGVNFKATQKIIIGAEYLHDSVDVLGLFDVDVDTLTVRASYKF